MKRALRSGIWFHLGPVLGQDWPGSGHFWVGSCPFWVRSGQFWVTLGLDPCQVEVK